MIKVVFDSEKRARVQFSGEVVHGVSYKGCYTAIGEVGVGWHGRFDGPHRPADFPACGYYALHASREDKAFTEPSRAARLTLSTRCLAAVAEAARKDPRLLVAAEAESLQTAVERAEEAYQEAKKEAERLFNELVDKAKTLENYKERNGLVAS